jgi:hypothetical protein
MLYGASGTATTPQGLPGDLISFSIMLMLDYFILMPRAIIGVEQRFVHRSQHFAGQTV